MKYIRILTAVFIFIVAGALRINAQHPSHNGHPQHPDKSKSAEKASSQRDGHHDSVNQRGDKAMGFSHAKTTHHFLLKTDGGVIQVDANDTGDTTSRDQIRQHLKHIAKKFAVGDFNAPMFIHGQTPPGVPVMQRLKVEIKYEFEESDAGGSVRITTNNPEARKAIHDFMRFQIKDHQTGDSGEVESGGSREG